MIYGKELVEWTLGPHYHAINAAQRDRLIAHMEKEVSRLSELTSPIPPQLAAGEKPLGEGDVYWEVLFASDVALPNVRSRLEVPFASFAATLESQLSVLPETERARIAASARGLGTDLAAALVAEFASEYEVEAFARIPERFVELLRYLEEAAKTVGSTRVKRWLGWGKDLDSVLGPLRRFNEILGEKRAQVLEGQIPLEELRRRMRGTSLARSLDEMLDKLEKESRQVVEGTPKRIMVTNYIESFSTYLKVSLIFAVLLTLPFILYELWKFIGAGLYPHEQKYVVTLLPFSLGLFAAGMFFGYFVLIPVGLEFLAGWGLEEVDLNFTLASYVGLFFTLTLILGLVFQTPLVMIFLSKIGVMSVEKYRAWRRPAIFIGVVLAVVLTPPDPFSWSLMAIPMLGLYEVGIFACQILQPRAGRSTTPVPAGPSPSGPSRGTS
jgi:Tat protein translocase TatC